MWAAAWISKVSTSKIIKSKSTTPAWIWSHLPLVYNISNWSGSKSASLNALRQWQTVVPLTRADWVIQSRQRVCFHNSKLRLFPLISCSQLCFCCLSLIFLSFHFRISADRVLQTLLKPLLFISSRTVQAFTPRQYTRVWIKHSKESSHTSSFARMWVECIQVT